MITGAVINWKEYHYGLYWQLAFSFLETLDNRLPAGKYEIKGEDIFAQVSEYQTANPVTVSFEAHKKYVDIQSVLSGKEIIEYCPLTELPRAKKYIIEKDIMFYTSNKYKSSKLLLVPGRFAVFFNSDAHKPGLTVSGRTATVKKIVIKIRRVLLINT